MLKCCHYNYLNVISQLSEQTALLLLCHGETLFVFDETGWAKNEELNSCRVWYTFSPDLQFNRINAILTPKKWYKREGAEIRFFFAVAG